MATGHHIETRQHTGHVRVEHDGQVVAETDRAVELDETGMPTRLYIPREDVKLDLLEASETTTHCPFKGDATYFAGPDGEDVAWTYEEPLDERGDIAGHVAFLPDRVQVSEGP